jgi:hypothetical protein
VPDPGGFGEFGCPISAAANISTVDPVGNFPVRSAAAPNAPKLPVGIQEGWLLVRAFLSIRSSERRQAVLNYVSEQAQMDEA